MSPKGRPIHVKRVPWHEGGYQAAPVPSSELPPPPVKPHKCCGNQCSRCLRKHTLVPSPQVTVPCAGFGHGWRLVPGSGTEVKRRLKALDDAINSDPEVLKGFEHWCARVDEEKGDPGARA